MEAMIRWFEQAAQRLPLEVFVLLGAFVEEIISPIPSFVVLIPAGAAAQVQELSWWYLPVLALLSACGRIVASIILYMVAQKGADWLFGSGRRLFGVSRQQLQQYGDRLTATNRGWWSLLFLNAIPILPTSLLSLTCGFLRIGLATFIPATFVGTAINALCYLSIGYAGVRAARLIGDLQGAAQILTILIVLGLFVWFVQVRRRRHRRGL